MRTRTPMSQIRHTGPARVLAVAGRVAALSAVLIATVAFPASARAFAHTTSQRVALIPQAGPLPAQGPNGIMPTSSHVSGRPTESFSRFSFHNLPLRQVTGANLAHYDTVALIEVNTASLTPSEKAAVAEFVANGGKLLIHDADETKDNDYSWLLPDGPNTTHIGQGCNNCGSSSGSSIITTNTATISANPSDPSYVDIGQLYRFTDQGDANLLVSTDPRWFTLVRGVNGRGESGASMAYANNNGLVIYNGFDTDFIKSSAAEPWRCNDADVGFGCPPAPAPQPTVDWLAQMWYSELAQGWGRSSGANGGHGAQPGSLGPSSKKPVIDVGTLVPTGAAGLPTGGSSIRGCVGRTGLFLRLRSLLHLQLRKIVQADVYVNGRHVLRERRPFTNRTLALLPRGSSLRVTVIATTRRGYHLIAKRHYRRC